MIMERATEDDVECIVFTEDRFSYITLGKIYEVKRRRLNFYGQDYVDELYVIDDYGGEYHWLGTAKGEYLKYKKSGST